ncbi:NADP-dependent oxidoreductase [Nocardia goodfellowii]|uniref:NADPH-dependent curcumin reductase CurA n=1 Tax=Nocardia goodfellowii TaxID=882446 RepID=A0ABS4QKA4_9NOCA|nr:NADP-dependent oxidoreductase [Nocardia goodfellowii]MBP2192138.1 NADPH-dependent curcumin reductase CurA [Nocardia goodfellowii]
MTKTQQVRLAERPTGLPTADTWELTTTELPDLGPGQILVKVAFISLDPAMRGWLNDVRSYVPPVGIGEVMRSLDIATVVESTHPDFAVGDTVSGTFGVTEYAISDGRGVQQVDLGLASGPTWLGALGMPGMTAYFGLLDVGKLRAGDTVLISAAAGAVGSVAGQIAKVKGATVIGIAGGAEKCRMLTEELGFDAAIDYRAGDVLKQLRTVAPDGIDIYFDNVGGEILDAALANLRRGARIVLCGAISAYNEQKPPPGPSRYMSLLVFRATMTGFVVFDYADRYPEAGAQLGQWLAEGRIQTREHVVEGGVARFGETLNMLFTGANTGKLVLAV